MTVKEYPSPASEMQDQSAQWLAIRRDRPDWMIMWGWGAMNPTAVKRAAKNGYPMDHFIGIWWAGSRMTMARGGGRGQGLSLARTSIGSAPTIPVIQDIQKYVVDKGKTQVEKEKFAENFYNRGVYNSVHRRGSNPQRAESHRQKGRQR